MCLLLLSASSAAAVAPSPWWRRVAELPDRAMTAIAWPVKKGVIFAEQVNLPARVQDALYFNDERTAGWFPSFSFGGEIQSALGIRLFHDDWLGGGEEVSISTLFATNDFEEKRVSFRTHLPPLDGSSAWATAEVLFQEDNDEDFFVRRLSDGRLRFGSETGRDDDTTYELDVVRGHLETGFEAAPGIRLGIDLQPIYGDVEEGGGAEPPIPAVVDGFAGPTVLVGGESFAEWDLRDSGVRTHDGWFAHVRGGAWAGARGETTRGRDYRYARYRVDLRRHQPTFRHDRSIVLRVALDRIETFGGGAAPFWELPTLDEDHALRGFDRNRFRNEGSFLFNVEYRYPIWELWDFYLFLDEGQVFRHYSEVGFDRFEWSAGAGVLFFSQERILFRAQFGASEEDGLFRIDLEQAF